MAAEDPTCPLQLFCLVMLGVTMAKMLKTSAENRKCTFPNCEHTLSIYNHEPYCYIHRDQMPKDQKYKTMNHAHSGI
jgi:hypothetical protein